MTAWEKAVVEAKAAKAAAEAKQTRDSALIVEGAHEVCEYLHDRLGVERVNMTLTDFKANGLPVYLITYYPVAHVNLGGTLYVGSNGFNGHTYTPRTNTLEDVNCAFGGYDRDYGSRSFCNVLGSVHGLLTDATKQRYFDDTIQRKLEGLATEMVKQGLI